MSLQRISLRDFVIVHALDLDLSLGFTVLTGETGAGKSILIDALQLSLGARADAGVVREGAARCEISTEFDTTAHVTAWLEDAGFAAAETLLLRRTIDNQGKSRAWINGSPATIAQLKSIAEHLVDIHGQHAWQSLTRPESVRGLLDAYAQISTRSLAQTWQQWRAAQKALSQALEAQDSLQRERDRLVWQIGELGKLAPKADEWSQINVQHARLSNAQALRDTSQASMELLQEAPANAISLISRAIAGLQGQSHVEPSFVPLADLLTSALAQVEDVARSLHNYERHAELDPQALTTLDERLSMWLSLARRYRRSPADLPELLQDWQQELKQLDANADVAALEKAERSQHAAYLEAARRVSVQRHKAAPKLASAITQAMQGLGMQGGRFEIVLTTLEQAAADGLEHAEFLVAGHSGSTPRPVGKVASGGELSRLALAIAVTTSELGEAPTLIFDEVDSGVGGAVGETVGRLMQQLGKDRQVMAVTHLAQVATWADQHLVVAKKSNAQSAFSTVDTVEGEARVAEIARMLGGERLSDTTRAHAREMLAR